MKDLIKKIKPYFPFILALIAGAAMPFGFAPYDFGIAAILSCTLFLMSLAKISPAKGFLTGWIYGLGMFGVGVNWVYVSISNYGNATPLLAGVITAAFIMILALFPAFLGYTLNKFFKKNDALRCLLAFPALWVLFEILRGWVFTGFPWLYVGYSQMGNHLQGFASVGSVWAVSWATVFVAALLYAIMEFYYTNNEKKKYRNKLIISMIAIWCAAFGAHRMHWVAPADKSFSIGLVQGNIEQLMRWDPEHVASIVQTYENLSAQVLDQNIIVWPEAAIPIPMPQSLPFFQTIDALGKKYGNAFFIGVPTELADKTHYYNSILGVGLASGIYHKTHLVPFGEYVPFENYLRGLIGFFNIPMSTFVSGSDDQKVLANNKNLLSAYGMHFAPALCYEIAYPLYVQQLSRNADFILTISNDAWFGHSIGPYQHLQIAQFRALETGKEVIRATNTGFTAVIDYKGEIKALAPAFTPTVLKSTIVPTIGQTPWVRYGIWPLLGSLIFILALAGFLKYREED